MISLKDFPPCIEGETLKGKTIAGIQAEMDTIRTCTIAITNHLPVPLKSPKYYSYSGWLLHEMPQEIGRREKEVVAFYKTAGTATGVVGVLTYEVGDTNLQIAAMFSVPYDYNWSVNWLGVGIVSVRANDVLYNEMYYDAGWDDQPGKNRQKASTNWIQATAKNVKLYAKMSEDGRALMEIVATPI